MDYEFILNRLYSDYYLHNGFSDVANSYWKKYGEQSVVIKEGVNYKLSGVCFGAFVERSALNYLKNLPQIFMYEYLFKKYNINKELKGAGKKIIDKQNRILDFDCVKQVLSLDLILKHNVLVRPKIFAVIGDGYGFMTSLIKMVCPEITVISVNLGRILFFDAYYAQKIFPRENVILINRKEDIKDIRNGSIVFLEAEKYNFLFSSPVDLFINIAGMQEMDTNVINTYFDIMRSSTVKKSYFYCCNRVEKKMPDGISTKFFNYPWCGKDKIIVDELCPWYQKYPSRYPPFWRSFMGPIWHRLVELHREKNDTIKI